MRTITLAQLLEDVHATTAPIRWKERDLRPLKGSTWKKQKKYALKRIRHTRISRIRRLALYYWLGNEILQDRSTRGLTPENVRAAKRMYQIFSPIGPQQLVNTCYVSPRALSRLHGNAIRKAVEAAEARGRDSSIDNVGIESEGVLTSVSPTPITAPLPITLDDIVTQPSEDLQTLIGWLIPEGNDHAIDLDTTQRGDIGTDIGTTFGIDVGIDYGSPIGTAYVTDHGTDEGIAEDTA